MRLPLRMVVLFLLTMGLSGQGAGSAYNARPKLVVVIIIDQFRGDYLERYREQWGDSGFRLFLERGANFPSCYYDYANTRTAPGHATLLTGAYSNGHGIMANEWWDARRVNAEGKAEPGMVTSVWDATRSLLGYATPKKGGASPHNLQATTLGDELKLATQGKARVFALAMKDRAAILTGGFSADRAYWMDRDSGTWISSDYYGDKLPDWAAEFNRGKRAEKYWNLEWKAADGTVLRTTTPKRGKDGAPTGFYDIVGATPLGNDYELEFARELVTQEKLGSGPATDLLIISLSPNDLLGHATGPDSREMREMALSMDRQLSEFFGFLGRQVGLANVWLALSADHGVAPLPEVAKQLRIPAASLNGEKMREQLNDRLAARFSPGRKQEFVKAFDYPVAWLDAAAFSASGTKEAEAERAVGEAMKELGLRGFYTRAQLAAGEVPNTEEGRRFLHSYAPLATWNVLGVPAPFAVAGKSGTDHATPFSYDTHVPLAFFGLAFQPGTYRTHCEPVDLAPTLSSLLGINAPSHAVGRVLTEAVALPRRAEPENHPASSLPVPAPKPAVWNMPAEGTAQ